MKRTLITLAMTLAVAAPALADEALAKSKNCMACHAVDKKLVGPAYKDVAKKYAGQKDAEATLITHVMKGSKGVWGPVPMPANAQVNEAEAKKLVESQGTSFFDSVHKRCIQPSAAAPSGPIGFSQLIEPGPILWPHHVAARHECPQTPQALRAGALRRLLGQLVSAN